MVFYTIGDTENSNKYFGICIKECTDFFNNTGDVEYIKPLLSSTSKFEINALSSEMKLYLEACYTKINDNELKAKLDCKDYNTLLYQLIGIYSFLSENELMISVIDEAIKNTNNCSEDHIGSIAYLYYLKGFPLWHLGQREESEESFLISKALCEKDSTSEKSFFYLNILLFEFENFRTEESVFQTFENTKKNIEIHLRNRNNFGLANSYVILMEVYSSLNLYDSAYSIYLKTDSLLNLEEFKNLISYKNSVKYCGTKVAIGLKNYTLADSLIRQRSKVLNITSHWNTRDGFNLKMQQGELKLNQGDFTEARSIYLKILDIYQSLNVKMERKCEIIFQLSKSEFFLNNDQDAFSIMNKGLDSVYSLLQDYSHFLTDGDLEGYILGIIEKYDYLFTILERNDNPGYNKEVYDGWLNNQHYVLNRIGRLRNMIQFSPELKDVYDKLKEVQRKLSVELSGKNDRQEIVRELMEEKNQYESLLAKTASNLNIDLKQITSNDLIASLKPGEIIIELVKYKSIKAYNEGDDNFGAFITSHSEDSIQFVNLFPASYIKDKLQNKRILRGSMYCMQILP
ncbi:MAG: hypothetical protein IPI60_13790 [Saprospiraceae bacterium]|nr:hypothetical protein [Saprospiraceae bacterium]